MKPARADSVWAALGGALVGYVLWLIAMSIGDHFTTAGVWGPIILAVSAALALVTTLWGRRARGRGNRTVSAFALAMPVLPVLLSLLVVADSYL